jgi:signal transduction histidine kinase
LRILYDDQGAVMGTAIDFTEHKRAQQEIALLAHAVKDLREAACVTISTETTALKQAEQAARVSEQRYGVILQSISDEALIVDEHGLIETINDAAALRANQASRSPTPGLRLIDIYPRDFVRRRSVAVKKVLLQKEPLHITEKLSYGFQHTWLSTKINPLLGQDGSCTKVVLVSRDVTMEKEREEFLRSFSRSILSAQEEERKRVSRELHDGLAQSLAALRMDLTRLGNQPAADQRTWESQTGRAIATVSLLIDETRRIAQNLTPAILEDIGLTTAIRKLVSEFAAAHGMKSRWHLSNIDDYFTQAEAIHIYRVIQEVTNNIERHSLARNITVSIQCQNGGVEFLILDDGVGFDTGQALASSTVGGNHRGLRGLQERARLLEGSLEITSAPGEGTLVALRIPTTGKRGN